MEKLARRIKMLKEVGAPWSIMLDVEARFDRVKNGQASATKFLQFLNAEIARFTKFPI